MSAVYSAKLRIFTLVITTANLINERTTRSLGMTHSILAPIALFTTFIFIGVMLICAARKKYASLFLQVYALISCSCLHTYLSIVVFKELRANPTHDRQAAMVLNGVLPMLIIFTLLADLIVTLFSSRNTGQPVLPTGRPISVEL